MPFRSSSRVLRLLTAVSSQNLSLMFSSARHYSTFSRLRRDSRTKPLHQMICFRPLGLSSPSSLSSAGILPHVSLCCSFCLLLFLQSNAPARTATASQRWFAGCILASRLSACHNRIYSCITYAHETRGSLSYPRPCKKRPGHRIGQHV